MTRFVIVSLLAKELNELINPIREHFEPGVSFQIPPHITLHFPFWLKSGEEKIYEKVKELVGKLKSFTAKIGNPDTFSHTGGVIDRTPRVLYLKVLPKEQFVTINKQLTAGLKDFVTIDTSFFPDQKIPDYLPHITLAMKAKNVDLTPFARSPLANVIGKPFLVSKLVVLSNEKKEGMWKIERMFELATDQFSHAATF